VSTPSTTDRPGLIEARPVRHSWRWVAIAIIALLVAMMANLVFTNPAFDWGFVFKAMVQTPVLRGLYIGTLLTTVLAMAVGIAGGVLTAVMGNVGAAVSAHETAENERETAVSIRTEYDTGNPSSTPPIAANTLGANRLSSSGVSDDTRWISIRFLFVGPKRIRVKIMQTTFRMVEFRKAEQFCKTPGETGA